MSTAFQHKTYEEFKGRVSEFFKAREENVLTLAEIKNGHKAIVLTFINRDHDVWTAVETYQSEILLKLVGEALLEAEFAEIYNEV